MFHSFSESETFVGEALVLGEISLVSSIDIGHLLSSHPKNIYFYEWFPWDQTFSIS